jgi:uncharacterized membrane protein YphA (DoxX/SURF4 family)
VRGGLSAYLKPWERDIITPRERDIEELKNKIEESENKLKRANQKGPLVVAVLGILLCLTLFTGLSVGFFAVGLILILSAVVWAYTRTRELVKQKESIFLNKMEIYRIENKP